MKTFTALASGLVLAAAAAAPALATSEIPLNVAVSSQGAELGTSVAIGGTTVPAAAVGFTAFGAVVAAGAAGSSDSTTTTPAQ